MQLAPFTLRLSVEVSEEGAHALQERRVPSLVVVFIGGGAASFRIYDCGLTATRNANDDDRFRLICAWPIFSRSKRTGCKSFWNFTRSRILPLILFESFSFTIRYTRSDVLRRKSPRMQYRTWCRAGICHLERGQCIRRRSHVQLVWRVYRYAN